MTPFHAIDGGLDAFERAFAERALVGALKQRRFGAHLDRIGPPGDAAWDPIQGYVRLRGANFAAEQVGSFDGRSWLWSWANDHLRIPDDKTTVARKLRDEVGLPAFRSSMIAAADERLPYMMAGFALAHSDRCGYFIANRSQVYVMAPLPELAGPVTLAELAETSRALRAEPVMPYDAARALRFAAETFGLEHEANDEHVRVTIGGESLDVDVASGRMGRLAVAFLAGRGTLEQLVEQLRTVDGAPELTVEKGSAWATGPGWRARVSCVDTLRTVMAEANALPGRHEEGGGDGDRRIVRGRPGAEPERVPVELGSGSDGGRPGRRRPDASLATRRGVGRDARVAGVRRGAATVLRLTDQIVRWRSSITRARSSSKSKGLPITVAPRAAPNRWSSSSANAEIRMTGKRQPRARMSSRASVPFQTGIRTSQTSRSGMIWNPPSSALPRR